MINDDNYMFDQIELFQKDIRNRCNEVNKLKKIDPFKSGVCTFSPYGINPSTQVCESEACTYFYIAIKVFEQIESDIKQRDPEIAHQFILHFSQALENDRMSFSSANTPGVKSYLRFPPDIVNQILSEYFIDGDRKQMINILINFRPIYTEMLLTDARALRNHVQQIVMLLDQTKKNIQITVPELNHYYSQLIWFAFESKDNANAITYIRRIMANYGPLKYRVIPNDYKEPELSKVPRRVQKNATGNTTIHVNTLHGNLNNVNTITSSIDMSTSNTNNGSGTQNNVTGNQNTGSGVQNNRHVNTENSGIAAGMRIAGENSPITIGIISVVVIILAYKFGMPSIVRSVNR